MARLLLLGAVVLANLFSAQAFYLPGGPPQIFHARRMFLTDHFHAVGIALCGKGVAPRDYKRGDKVDVWVNAYSSPDTVIPFDYYYEQFHMCPPENGPKGKGESLGSILFGDRLYDSRFVLKMQENTTCNKLCSAEVTINGEDGKFINARIKEEYSVNWIVDGLPAARMGEDRKTGKTFYSIGFELGSVGKNGKSYLNNHYEIAIQYHTVDDENFRVVGVLVWPFSVKKWSAGDESTCYRPEDAIDRVLLDEKNENKVQFTYNVNWIPSAISWATRWDNYLYVFDPKIHWFSLINSVVIVLFLSGMVAMVLLRALHKDIARYNSAEVSEDAQEEFGWKLVHGDVFRPPQHYQMLSVLVGNGAQLLLMTTVTLGGLFFRPVAISHLIFAFFKQCLRFLDSSRHRLVARFPLSCSSFTSALDRLPATFPRGCTRCLAVKTGR
jgi:transmembrane 9 superfamily protein 2/4